MGYLNGFMYLFNEIESHFCFGASDSYSKTELKLSQIGVLHLNHAQDYHIVGEWFGSRSQKKKSKTNWNVTAVG